uniref:RING-type domain-containing protein n=1 Tax=Davidia involucrata TaxID=16924 RepID=A0A5B6YGH7_DAVIN
MDGVERRRRVWKDLKQRLGIKGIGFCGSSWSVRASDINAREDGFDEDEQYHEREDEEEQIMGMGGDVGQIPAADSSIPPCVGQTPAPTSAGMNLATALAAERNQRSVGPTIGVIAGRPVAPLKSLMRLFEETDGVDGMKRKKRDREGEGEVDSLCCVCIERNKGAAFIPCGHTFCRVCSRELWLNRGSCPLCNRSIIEILDIY